MPPRGSFGRRMDKEWNSIPGIDLNLAASATASGGFLSLGTAGTILRMIGEYIITPRLAPTAVDSVFISLGIGVVSSDAAAAGAASLPDPAGEPDFPWLFWATHSFFFSTTTTDPSDAGSSLRRAFDIRSMRKMKPRESLIFVVEYANVIGNPDMQINLAQTRVLIGGV